MPRPSTVGQKKTLAEVVRHICERRLQAGARLSELALAQMIGTSRAPVKAILRYLETEGVVTYEKNRGFALRVDSDQLPESVIAVLREPDDLLYGRLAEERISGKVSGSMTESTLMRQLNATRAGIRKVVMRAQQEGWAVKEAGYGVRFLPIIDNQDAYDDMYRLRLAIEPAGLLSPRFKADMAQLQSLREEQQALLDGGHRVLTPVDRFESNARFHETIASWSQNQLALQTLRNLYQMRRLAEYRQEKQAQPRQIRVSDEHLKILDAIEQGDTITAASLLKRHISEAITARVETVDFDA